MKIRKLLAHRARLSHTKPTGFYRTSEGRLRLWNMRGQFRW